MLFTYISYLYSNEYKYRTYIHTLSLSATINDIVSIAIKKINTLSDNKNICILSAWVLENNRYIMYYPGCNKREILFIIR